MTWQSTKDRPLAHQSQEISVGNISHTITDQQQHVTADRVLTTRAVLVGVAVVSQVRMAAEELEAIGHEEAEGSNTVDARVRGLLSLHQALPQETMPRCVTRFCHAGTRPPPPVTVLAL